MTLFTIQETKTKKILNEILNAIAKQSQGSVKTIKQNAVVIGGETLLKI
jgi:predicted lactoylglutathione lyase